MNIGSRRVSKELDIVKFIRKQMIVDVILKTLFSKEEQFLIKRQKQFYLDQNSYKSSSSDIDIEMPSANSTTSQFYNTLLQGA